LENKKEDGRQRGKCDDVECTRAGVGANRNSSGHEVLTDKHTILQIGHKIGGRVSREELKPVGGRRRPGSHCVADKGGYPIT